MGSTSAASQVGQQEGGFENWSEGREVVRQSMEVQGGRGVEGGLAEVQVLIACRTIHRRYIYDVWQKGFGSV